jgi:hypothetical protein
MILLKTERYCAGSSAQSGRCPSVQCFNVIGIVPKQSSGLKDCNIYPPKLNSRIASLLGEIGPSLEGKPEHRLSLLWKPAVAVLNLVAYINLRHSCDQAP